MAKSSKSQPTKPAKTPSAPIAAQGAGDGVYYCPSRTKCIKGNVGDKGEKIYHFPGCPNYAMVKISKPTEAYFYSSRVAELAGFRRAQN